MSSSPSATPDDSSAAAMLADEIEGKCKRLGQFPGGRLMLTEETDLIVKALRSFARSAIAAPAWISLKDGLPETGERVLACTSEGKVGCEYVHNLRFMNHDGSYWTHWQPLPVGVKS